MAFTSLGNINVKGKVDAIDIFSPYPPLPPTLLLPWQVSSSRSGAPSTLSVKEVPPQDAGAFASAHSKYGTDAPALGKVPSTSPSASPSDDYDDGNLYRHFHLRQLEIQASWRQLRSLQVYFDRQKDAAKRLRAQPIGGGADVGNRTQVDLRTTKPRQDSDISEADKSSSSNLTPGGNGTSMFASAVREYSAVVSFTRSMQSQISSRSRDRSSTSVPPRTRGPGSTDVPNEANDGNMPSSATVRESAAVKFMSARAAGAARDRSSRAVVKPAFYAGKPSPRFLASGIDNMNEVRTEYTLDHTNVASLGGAIYGNGAFPFIARSPPLKMLNGLIPVGALPAAQFADKAHEQGNFVSTDNSSVTISSPAGPYSNVMVIVTVDQELLQYGGEIAPFQLPISDHATFWDLFEASARAAVEAGAEQVRRQHGRTATTAFSSSGAVERSIRDSVATAEEAGYNAGHTGYSDDSGDDGNDEDDAAQQGGVEGDPETRRVRRLVAKLLKDATLVVTGTRLLLPMDRKDPLPHSVLPLFIAEALRMRSGMPQDHDLAATIADGDFTNLPGSNGRPVRVSFVRKASLPGLSSRAVAARTALLSAQCRLLLKHPSSNARNGSEDGKAPKAGGLHLLTGPPVAGKSYLVSSSLVDAVPPRAAEAIFGTSYGNDDTDNSEAQLLAAINGNDTNKGTAAKMATESKHAGTGGAVFVSSIIMRYAVTATSIKPHARRPGEFPPPHRAAPWAQVITQYLDHRAATDGTVPADENDSSESMDRSTTDSTSASDAQRAAKLKTALARTTATRTAQLTVELQASDPSGALLKSAHVLNPFLSTSLESPQPSSGAPDPEEVEILLFAILQRLAAWRPSIVLIDDCHYLDQGSWRLSVAVATGALPLDNATTIASNNGSSGGGIGGGLPLLCIIVGRPVAFRGMYQRLPPASLLAQSVAVTSAQLDGLPSDVLEGVYISALGHEVRGLSGDLFVLLERTCLGVPGIALEFLGNLRARNLLRFLPISGDNLLRGHRQQ